MILKCVNLDLIFLQLYFSFPRVRGKVDLTKKDKDITNYISYNLNCPNDHCYQCLRSLARY